MDTQEMEKQTAQRHQVKSALKSLLVMFNVRIITVIFYTVYFQFLLDITVVSRGDMTALYVNGWPKRNVRVCLGNKTYINFK